jgi:hypothetical protein
VTVVAAEPAQRAGSSTLVLAGSSGNLPRRRSADIGRTRGVKPVQPPLPAGSGVAPVIDSPGSVVGREAVVSAKAPSSLRRGGPLGGLASWYDHHRSGRTLVAVWVLSRLLILLLLAGGWARLLSPLTWQSDRGLQIESVWATPVMVARALSPGAWLVDISRYQAYEVFGPAVGLLLAVSTVATVLGLGVIVALLVRAHRDPEPSAVAVGLVILATVAVMTVTNKTLSPQYLLWLGGPMAALLLLRARDGEREQREVGRLAGQLLLLALLTQLVYPLLYDGLLGRQGHGMVVVATLVTAARNVFLVVFTVEACRLAWRRLSPARRPADRSR